MSWSWPAWPTKYWLLDLGTLAILLLLLQVINPNGRRKPMQPQKYTGKNELPAPEGSPKK